MSITDVMLIRRLNFFYSHIITKKIREKGNSLDINQKLLRKLATKSTTVSIHGSLTNLWRRILKDLGATEKLLSSLSSYNKKFRDNSSGIVNSSTMKINAFSDTISITTLVSLISSLLHVKEITISVTLTHKSGKKTQHSEVVFRDAVKEKGKNDGK